MLKSIEDPHFSKFQNLPKSYSKITFCHSPKLPTNYAKIPENIKVTYNKILKICDKYKVPIPAAALQFSYANTLISSMILGMDRSEQVNQNIYNLEYQIPSDLWKDLIEENIIDERCPTN